MPVTQLLPTHTEPLLQKAVQEAVRILRMGEPVALPTETVYGLAADALNPAAAGRIFEAKERPFFDPLICHLPDLSWLERMAKIPPVSESTVRRLAEAFWPGPLTLVLPRQPGVPDLVTAGLDTVALRMSAHPVFGAVAQAFGSPLAAPSANRFGRISPTTAEHVVAELDARILLVLDGGPTKLGVESTIVAVEGEGMRILRPGPVTAEALAAFGPVSFARQTGSDAPEAPGQLESHYAPTTPMYWLGDSGELSGSARERIGLLAWRVAPVDSSFEAIEVLSPSGDLSEAAATLFAKMRRLDSRGLAAIYCERVPESGLGLAIMDRLQKATGGGEVPE
jgi:L-threonylcarbamoyladenylate synthase